ncbi:hypothetical protein [Nonomuraea sp. JJY05]
MLGAGPGLLYTGTLTVLAAVSVYGWTPSRRRNALTRGAAGSDEDPGGQ